MDASEQQVKLEPWFQRGAWPVVNVAVGWSALVTAGVYVVQTTQYLAAMDKRIALVEQSLLQQSLRDERQDRYMLDAQLQERDQINKIETKLDRMWEANMLLHQELNRAAHKAEGR